PFSLYLVDGRSYRLSFALVLAVLSADGPRGAPAQIAFDRLTLRDRSVVAGVITGVVPGQRGAVDILIRRDWGRKNVARWMPVWERSFASAARGALAQRQERLRAWRQDRAAAKAPDDDRVIKWIDHELTRLSAPDVVENSVLL